VLPNGLRSVDEEGDLGESLAVVEGIDILKEIEVLWILYKKYTGRRQSHL